MNGGARIYVGICSKNAGIGIHLEGSQSDEHWSHMEPLRHFTGSFLIFTMDPRSPVSLMEKCWFDLSNSQTTADPLLFLKRAHLPHSPWTSFLHHLRVEIPSLKSSPGPKHSSKKSGAPVVRTNKGRSFQLRSAVGRGHGRM